MAKLGKTFDSDQHGDMNNFDPVPAGWYPVKAVESSIEATSKKTGKYIKVKFEIVKGDFKGRFIWTQINIINPNPVAVEIGQKELATLCRACEVVKLKDTQQLHGKVIAIKVKVKPAKGDYAAANEPTGYLSMDAYKEMKAKEKGEKDESDEDFPEDEQEEQEEVEEEETSDDAEEEADDDVPWEDD